MIGGVALGVALTGSTAAAQPCPKGTLHIYASWTMQGAMLSASTGMMNGVDMAVAEAGGVAGGYCLDADHQPIVHGPDHSGRHLSRPHEEPGHERAG
jgi:hypothetical protein